MYDGHSDPKQFLMSYEATISSYGGNTAVMVKSYVHGSQECGSNMIFFSSARNNHIVVETEGYLLVTSFQGFQTKLVTAQALFQCT
jgi:hypothetical protein